MKGKRGSAVAVSKGCPHVFAIEGHFQLHMKLLRLVIAEEWQRKYAGVNQRLMECVCLFRRPRFKHA